MFLSFHKALQAACIRMAFDNHSLLALAAPTRTERRARGGAMGERREIEITEREEKA